MSRSMPMPGLGQPADRDERQVPVLLLIFNRPETTRAVVERIRAEHPRALYIAADGPRAGVAGEAERCKAARAAVTEMPWDCPVKTLFRESNLGCGRAVSSGITWFFEQEPYGIVLEDDCVPGDGFFRFCTELLMRYRDDERVMHIAGNSFQYGRKQGRASYYFSRITNIWGWATWRRAWEKYDFNLRPAWELADTWDTQWQLSVSKAGGLAISPNANLVSNIGFGEGATHTRGEFRFGNLPAEGIVFPLVHPARMEANRAGDTFTYYAHHRMVKHLNLIWMYQLGDFLARRLKAIKRAVLRHVAPGKA